MYIATRHSIDVTYLEDGGEDAYEAFVRGHDAGLVYYSLAYRRLIEHEVRATPRYLVARRDGATVGVMPLFRQDGPYGTVYNAAPYFGSHGAPLAADTTVEAALLAAYDEITSASDVAAATVVANPLAPPSGDVPADVCDARIGQFTPLPGDAQPAGALMDAFHSKTRNMIRKAVREGVVVDRDDDAVAFLASVHGENMVAKGAEGKGNAFFRRLTQLFEAGDGYRIYTASIDGERAAALLLLYYNGVVEYFTPAIRLEHRSSQALSLVIFQAMTDAAAGGFRLWNWGGTWPTQTSLHRFKKRWGTEDRPYTYFTRLGNADVRHATPEELLTAYPNMYVLPFSELLAMSKAA